MALPLKSFVQLGSGAIHPDFPTNVLQFWLLTDVQLESLATFYHQAVPDGTLPSGWAAMYPCPIPWRSDAPLETKRRRLGRFIGLRGCKSPTFDTSTLAPLEVDKSEEEIAREARLARRAQRSKTTPGPSL